MIPKENRHGAATPERQMAMEGFCSFTIPKENDSAFDGNISSLLSTGQDNSIPLRHLMMITGMDGRTVHRMISEERLSGIPILADNQTGYYLPAKGIASLQTIFAVMYPWLRNHRDMGLNLWALSACGDLLPFTFSRLAVPLSLCLYIIIYCAILKRVV